MTAANTGSLAVVADVGGTNTRVALSHGSAVDANSIQRFRNSEHESLDAVLSAYLSQTGAKPGAACVAIAGPVRDGVGSLTNLDWSISRDTIASATGASTVAVLNDLQAQGHAVDHIADANLQTILPGQPAGQHAARLMIGIGTGLNSAPVYRLGGQTLVPPAEAGHISIPAQTETELRLVKSLSAQHGMPSMEEVLSGRGFANLHAWICQEDGHGVPLEANDLMTAYQNGDPQADRAVTIFVTMLGRYASNLALISLPFGGIYLCGGVARHFAPLLLKHGFAEAFSDKGRFSDFVQQFPVHMISDDYAALTGCAGHLSELTA
ncbi:glucokinase [Thalassococcus lentus]|uniref:ROK family protein n=1 Tax=Thalassococcus lentus TaxID=1210524 RepID=A0ABT4XRP6_9RHOB|nr:ROK family protein [Thalassococcus lentus]MDA7424623.1 ROK family protein [Thalassococcus lentus]